MDTLGDIASLVRQNGFVHFESHDPNLHTLDVANSLGHVAKVPGLQAIQELKPKFIFATTPNVYSGNFGCGVFPLHTDLAHWRVPPKFMLLRCIGGSEGVATQLVDSSELLREVGELAVRRCIVQPRRPLKNARPLYRVADGAKLRWDSVFLVPATNSSGIVFARIREALRFLPKMEFVLRQPGDTLLVDNWRMLHGRSSVALPDMRRLIHRVYLGALRNGDGAT